MLNSLRIAMFGVALASIAGPALAQAPRQPARPPANAAPPQPEPPAPPPIFPCRTAEEICFLGVVVGQQVAILFTNAPHGSALDRPIDVTGPDNAKLDLTANEGRVVMLTGILDAKAGLTKAELVEVASPLASLAIKAQLGSGQDEEPPAPPAPPPGQKPAQPTRR